MLLTVEWLNLGTVLIFYNKSIEIWKRGYWDIEVLMENKAYDKF